MESMRSYSNESVMNFHNWNGRYPLVGEEYSATAKLRSVNWINGKQGQSFDTFCVQFAECVCERVSVVSNWEFIYIFIWNWDETHLGE